MKLTKPKEEIEDSADTPVTDAAYRLSREEAEEARQKRRAALAKAKQWKEELEFAESNQAEKPGD